MRWIELRVDQRTLGRNLKPVRACDGTEILLKPILPCFVPFASLVPLNKFPWQCIVGQEILSPARITLGSLKQWGNLEARHRITVSAPLLVQV